MSRLFYSFFIFFFAFFFSSLPYIYNYTTNKKIKQVNFKNFLKKVLEKSLTAAGPLWYNISLGDYRGNEQMFALCPPITHYYYIISWNRCQGFRKKFSHKISRHARRRWPSSCSYDTPGRVVIFATRTNVRTNECSCLKANECSWSEPWYHPPLLYIKKTLLSSVLYYFLKIFSFTT